MPIGTTLPHHIQCGYEDLVFSTVSKWRIKFIHYKRRASSILTSQKITLLWKKYKTFLAWPEFEPMTSWSEVHHANHCIIEASYKEGKNFHVESYNLLLFCEVKIEIHVTYNEWILIVDAKWMVSMACPARVWTLGKDPKRLGFVIYLGLCMNQFQKYHLLKPS